jgi:hypothetical protein
MNRFDIDIQKNIDKIHIKDKYNTLSELKRELGLDKPNGSKERKEQDKTLSKYISYEKTGKIKRGKISNEIQVVQIYNTNDRYSKRGSKYIDSLVDTLLGLKTSFYTNEELMILTGIKIDNNYNQEIELNKYIHELRTECRKKYESTFIYLTNQYRDFSYYSSYCVQRNDSNKLVQVTSREKEIIDDSINQVTIDLINQYNFENNTDKTFTQLIWNYSWRNEVYFPAIKRMDKRFGYVNRYRCFVINNNTNYIKQNKSPDNTFRTLMGERMKHKLNSEKINGVNKWGYSLNLPNLHNSLFDDTFQLSKQDENFIKNMKKFKSK